MGKIQQLLYNRAYEHEKALDAMHRAWFTVKALDCSNDYWQNALDTLHDIWVDVSIASPKTISSGGFFSLIAASTDDLIRRMVDFC